MQDGKSSWWQKNQFVRKRANLEGRDRMIRALRAYFYGENFSEVNTPALQISPGLEPHLHAFSTEIMSPERGLKEKLYLHTSPEFAMKKLLAAGMERIFQLSQVYRNRERSYTHHPEFTMLEWYRAGSSYTALMDDCENLLRACARAVEGNGLLTWRKVSADPERPFERISVAEAFLRYTETDLFGTITDPLHPQPDKLRAECRRLGVHEAADDSWDDLFFRIFLEKIEPKLGVGVPTILYDYPISMAALSRPKSSAPHLAERFELYVCGLELANAFGELTDARVQRERFERDVAKKKELYGTEYPIDPDFIAAVGDLPECAGIALGVDRLAMLAVGAEHIEDVLWAPVHDPAKP